MSNRVSVSELGEANIWAMRKLRESGWTYKQLARHFSIPVATVRAAVTGARDV